VEILATIFGAVRIGESEDTTTNEKLRVYFEIRSPSFFSDAFYNENMRYLPKCSEV
jgi:hypothetical protein